MLSFRQTIQSLAEQSSQQMSDDTFAITLYEKTGKLTPSELQTRIKSHLLRGLRSHTKLASLSKMHEKLVAHTHNLLNQLDKRLQGVAVFLQFNAPALEREETDNNKHSNTLFAKIITLYEEPETHIYVGKIFDFSPLFRIVRKTPLAIVAQITNQSATVYSLKGTIFEKETELENWHNQPTDKEYTEIHHASSTDQIHQGSGEANVARRQINANKVFLDEVAAPMTTLLTNASWKNVTIYASKNYQPYIESWAQETFATKMPYDPLIKYKIFKNKVELCQDAVQQLEKYNKEQIKEMFLADKEKYTRFAEGWKDVTDAVREFRVERLYIAHNNEKRSGFILNQTLPYSYPVKNAKKVRNLLPWLTQGVVAAGGSVVTGKMLSELSDQPIAGKLRYTS